jgi:hypothetical protein
MIGLLGTPTFEDPRETIEHHIEGFLELAPLTTGHNRLVPVYLQHCLDFLEMFFSSEHYLRTRQTGLVLAELPNLVLRSGPNALWDLTLTGRNLDSHLSSRGNTPLSLTAGGSNGPERSEKKNYLRE